MSKRAIAKKYPSPLCPELQAILDLELARGNVVSQPPELANWPEAGSVFASLEKDFKIRKHELPDHVSYQICNDPHYGWYGEYFCEVHKHLLVSGNPRVGEPMWQKVPQPDGPSSQSPRFIQRPHAYQQKPQTRHQLQGARGH
jgi:hypothetical protein